VKVAVVKEEATAEAGLVAVRAVAVRAAAQEVEMAAPTAMVAGSTHASRSRRSRSRTRTLRCVSPRRHHHTSHLQSMDTCRGRGQEGAGSREVQCSQVYAAEEGMGMEATGMAAEAAAGKRAA